MVNQSGTSSGPEARLAAASPPALTHCVTLVVLSHLPRLLARDAHGDAATSSPAVPWKAEDQCFGRQELR